MHNLILVVEKSQVTTDSFLQLLYSMSLLRLLPRIPGQVNTHHFIVYLDKATAVDAQYRTPAPHIRRIQPLRSQLIYRIGAGLHLLSIERVSPEFILGFAELPVSTS